MNAFDTFLVLAVLAQAALLVWADHLIRGAADTIETLRLENAQLLKAPKFVAYWEKGAAR